MANATGEDRSNYQKVGPWRQDFGFCKATEGLSYQDPSFGGNWATLRADGLPRGAYHFFHPSLSAAAQARYFMSYVKAHGLQDGDMLAIDCELAAGSAVRAMELHEPGAQPRMHLQPHVLEPEALASFSLEDAVLGFMDEVKSLAGPKHPLLVYTYQAMAETFSTALATRYPELWIAAYGTSSPRLGPWKGWRFWQFSGGGAPGGGDPDVYHGDRAALHSWLTTYHAATPPPPPPPAVPAWQHSIISRLPSLAQGARDTAGRTEWVKQAQLLLDVTGPGSVVADGDFGPATRAAVIASQRVAGLGQDGVIGPGTWQVLVASKPGQPLPARVAQGAADKAGAIRWVARIQALCDVHGIPATVDGIFGPATAAAVKGVQKAYGAAQTGVVDAYTWSLLIAHARP